eukprot:TRINITY_DN50457_c0_g1_i1.p2 TRINITY_DN50457_c0_g1~~TRINITY_DN50457_c0_g1_i1.p2  ORF type:complete len:188 (+),score=75.92 TRINITY_DN50457_c0_g1_i1:90-653(+)
MAMVKGTVSTWTGKFGFVDCVDGKVAYVHPDILPESKKALMLGREVRVSYEAVEGHQGRVKATRCVGAGLCAPEVAELSPKEKKGKKNKAAGVAPAATGGRAAGGGAVEKRKDVDGKLYTKAEFALEYKGQAAAKWDAAEQRRDSDGKWYTKQSFLEVYGGLREWNKAERKFKPAAAAAGRGRGRGK